MGLGELRVNTVDVALFIGIESLLMFQIVNWVKLLSDDVYKDTYQF